VAIQLFALGDWKSDSQEGSGKSRSGPVQEAVEDALKDAASTPRLGLPAEKSEIRLTRGHRATAGAAVKRLHDQSGGQSRGRASMRPIIHKTLKVIEKSMRGEGHDQT
jgi:hypothetical protein